MKERSNSRTYLVYSLVLQNTSYGYLVCDSVTANSMDFVALKEVLVSTLNRIDVHQQLERYSKKMEVQSLKDPMTDLFNRRGFRQLTESLYKKLVKSGSNPGVVYCDLVAMKKINDIHDHANGDIAIKEAASILIDFFKDGEIVARVGGDEFLIFINDLKEETLFTMRSRLNKMVSDRNQILNLPFLLDISFGVSYYNEGKDRTLEEMINEADERLYEGRRLKNEIDV